MNTPSHAILNLFILNQKIQPQANRAIFIGAILPDVPIFLFYFLMKFGYRLPSHQIWSTVYYQPFWQAIFSTFHSIPLAIIGIAIAHFYNWQVLKLLLISVLLNCLFDLLVHNNDAHRHFFSFSNYRFISPIFYWDSKHYGNIVAFGEILLVFMASISLFISMRSPFSKGLLLLVGLTQVSYFFRNGSQRSIVNSPKIKVFDL